MFKFFSKKHILAISVSIIFIFTFYETLHSIFLLWTMYGRGYSHGLLLFAISIYLGWEAYKNHAPNTPPAGISYFALIISFGLCVLWAATNLAGIAIGQQLLLPLILLALIAALFGNHYAKIFIFPISFLYLGLPFWDVSKPLLQGLTVSAVQVMVNASSLTAYVHGNYIQIPSGTFQVAQSCAGMRYMLVALTLTILHSYLSFQALLPRSIMILWGLGLSLLANWIRVYLIVLIGYKSQMQSSIVTDHDTFGWVVFAVTMAPMFFATNLIARWDRPASKEPHIVQNKASLPLGTRSHFNSTAALLVAAIMLLTTGLSNLPNFYERTATFTYPEEHTGTWHRSLVRPLWQPAFINASKTVNYSYEESDHQVALHVFYYEKQSEDSELVSDDNQLATSPWHTVATEKMTLAGGEVINRSIIRNGQHRKLVLHWYHIGERRFDTEIKAKLAQVINILTGDHSGRFVALSADFPLGESYDNLGYLSKAATDFSQLYKEI